MFQIKVVEISIIDKKLSGHTCLSPLPPTHPVVELGGSKYYDAPKWENRLTS